ncbi:putative phage abortive infection protein [Sulfurimonas sp.]|uniref:putative phage abortive infection protein n=1 Tax=Sulfurimonas sp. TaxID=2022749 RepID=UPI00286DA270|nr:putative phage abortive infection protein [Sulfurimonas sp.]
MNIFYSDISTLKIGIVFFLILIVIALFNNNSTLNLNKIYKITAFIIIINFLLSILTPNASIVSILDVNQTSYSNNWETRGQIGDFIAGHFTALAFIGLLISITQMQNGLKKQDEAINIQRDEMRLQREEMKLQREEMKESTKSLMLQAKLYEKQNFETTFFQLLKLYIDIVDNIQHNNITKPVITNKKEAISKYMSEFLQKKDGEMNSLKIFNETYSDFMNSNHQHLNHYFRTIYRIVKYVDEFEDIHSQIDKKFYVNLLRAQFTSFEVALMFFNGLSRDGANMKKYIEKYSLLEHLSAMKFFKKFDIEIIQKYDISAFGHGFFSSFDNQSNVFGSMKSEQE